jgi:hypothetical protein
MPVMSRPTTRACTVSMPSQSADGTDAAWTSGFCNYPDGTQTIPLLGAGSLIRAWFQSQD